MTPERAGPHLALMGIGLVALLTRGCVSDAFAADAVTVASVDPLQLINTLGLSGIGGWLALERLGHVGQRRQPNADNESSALRLAPLTREDVRTIAGELVQRLRDETDAAHDRVRATLTTHEARMSKIEDRAEAHRVEAAGALGAVQAALHAVQASIANLAGRLHGKEHDR